MGASRPFGPIGDPLVEFTANVPRWATIDVACRFVSKVAAEKVPSSGFDLSNTGICGAMSFSSTRSVCGIRGEPLRRESEALLRSFDHGLRRTDLQILRAIVVPRLPIDRQA